MAKNQLYYGDNLDVLKRYVKDESVDLVYLDPPFNSRADYNILFKEKSGEQSASQITAFEDTWEWNAESKHTYDKMVLRGDKVSDVMRAFYTFLGGGNNMMAYLAMMAPRLVELNRVLKPSGSIYLHCDPTASHYLKLLMDAVFGAENFANEIVWRRTTTKNDYKQGAVNWPRIHDVLLMYHRSTGAARDAKRFSQPFTAYDEEYLKTFYSFEDQDGRKYRLSDLTAPGQGSRGHPHFEFLGVTRYWRYNKEKMERLYAEGRIEFRPSGKVPRLKVYLDDSPGVAIGDVWTDVRGMINFGNEMLGYPTQKPEALLERIITASSNEGDVVLDPFCGCGTAVSAAQKLNRRWIGIDITHLAIGLIKTRLEDAFGKGVRDTYEVVGEPTDLESARVLANQDRFQFQAWALGLVNARTATSAKKGADRGIDGKLFFRDGLTDLRQVVISVKSGNVKAEYVRDLVGTVGREKADLGVLITLELPTKPMQREALEAGFFKSPHFTDEVPKIQIITIEELLAGKNIEIPHLQLETFKQAPKARGKKAENMTLDLGMAED